MSVKIIDRKIAQFVLNAGKVNILCHEIGMMILDHAIEHGDCSRAQKLVMAMPASMRRSMLILWFGTYSPIVVKDDSKWDAKMHKAVKADGTPNPKYIPFDREGAAANPFYQMAEENPEGKILSFDDLLKLVASLAKRIEKKVEEEKVSPEDIGSAKAVIAALTGLKVERVANNDTVKPLGQPVAVEVATPIVPEIKPVAKNETPVAKNAIALAMEEAAKKAA